MTDRPHDQIPRIVIWLPRLSGDPTIGETRISVDQVSELYWLSDMGTVLQTYDLTEIDVIVCCWWTATTRRRTKRAEAWAAWVEQAAYDMWHGRVDIKHPPTLEET